MTSSGNSRRIVIAGAGPAGTSLAIRLALAGLEVTLIEREKFPRHKLCGEFISPECLRHFAALGVLDQMISAGGQRIYETRFHDRRGRTFTVPSTMLDDHGFGLSLSRSRMDNILLDRARDTGVTVLDTHRITDIAADGPGIGSVTAASGTGTTAITGDLFVDATGRSSVLSKILERKQPGPKRKAPQRPLAVGFKAHLTGTRTEPGVCEIFSFPSGYGGLTPVEGGYANLCFMMAPRAARRLGSDPDRIVGEALCRNVRAAEMLENAGAERDWLAVSVNHYGRVNTPSAENLFTVGDSAAFIDPFTGSGMLMALESSALLAAAVASAPTTAAAIAHSYRASYDQVFSKRLRVCSILRRAAFVPVLPSLVVGFLKISGGSLRCLAGSVRTRNAAAPKIV